MIADDKQAGPDQESASEGHLGKTEKRTASFLTLALLLGGMGFVAAGVPNRPAGIVWSLACASIGWLAGFVFSLSRTVQSEARNQSYAQLVNTNLEQISDWLTKILVGLGLTQLNEIPKTLQSAASQVAEAIGGPQQKAFALGLIIYFSVVGFLASYLMTRLYINIWLRQAESPARVLQPPETLVALGPSDEIAAEEISEQPRFARQKGPGKTPKNSALENRMI